VATSIVSLPFGLRPGLNESRPTSIVSDMHMTNK
jgi:hypothetical protein